MRDIEEKYIDKSNWPDGPWRDEYDKRQFMTEAGLPALVVRHEESGHLCGYVGVPAGHPWYEVEYDNCEPFPDVHGGLTYSRKCQSHVCHTVEDGEDGNVWWLGFDCAHLGDLCHVKRLDRDYVSPDDCYRTTKYVERQCEQLAKQAKAVGS